MNWKCKKSYRYTLRTCVSEHRKTSSQSGGTADRNLKALQCPHRDLPRSFRLGILPLTQQELIREIVCLNNRGVRSRTCISIDSLTFRHCSVGKRASRPRCVLVLTCHRKPCCGPKKWRRSNQSTTLRRHSQVEGVDSRTLRCLMRRFRPP